MISDLAYIYYRKEVTIPTKYIKRNLNPVHIKHDNIELSQYLSGQVFNKDDVIQCMFMLCDPIKERITIKNDSYVLIPDTSKRICVAIIGSGYIVYNKKKDEDGADIRVTSEEKHERLVVDGQPVCSISDENAYDFNTDSFPKYLFTQHIYFNKKSLQGDKSEHYNGDHNFMYEFVHRSNMHNKCTKHPTVRTDLLCTTCNELCCTDLCWKTHHKTKGHKSKFIEYSQVIDLSKLPIVGSARKKGYSTYNDIVKRYQQNKKREEEKDR